MTNAETPARQRRPKEETARLGDEIYRRDVKEQVETHHDGEYVAIDVDSGNWAIAESELAASNSLRARCPDAIDVWLLRVGYRAVASIGGGTSTWRTAGGYSYRRRHSKFGAGTQDDAALIPELYQQVGPLQVEVAFWMF